MRGKKTKRNMLMQLGLNPDTLCQEISDIARRHSMNYIDATVFFCEQNDVEVESLAALIPPSLKALIEESARDCRMLKKQYNDIGTLPI